VLVPLTCSALNVSVGGGVSVGSGVAVLVGAITSVLVGWGVAVSGMASSVAVAPAHFLAVGEGLRHLSHLVFCATPVFCVDRRWSAWPRRARPNKDRVQPNAQQPDDKNAAQQHRQDDEQPVRRFFRRGSFDLKRFFFSHHMPP
jgi:hypothetical protein